MIINEEKQAEMLEAARPLIKWLCENCHPHCQVHVDQTTVMLFEGIATNQTNEYQKDCET